MTDIRNMTTDNSRLKSIYDPRYRLAINELANLRRQAQLSQKKLGDAIGLSQSDISKVENFQRRIDIIEFLDWVRMVTSDDTVTIMELWEKINAIR